MYIQCFTRKEYLQALLRVTRVNLKKYNYKIRQTFVRMKSKVEQNVGQSFVEDVLKKMK